MVKCNAYGHGLTEVSSALEASSRVLAFGVATLDEGITLRRAGIAKPIWIFSDCAPWTDELALGLRENDLTAIVHSVDDLRALVKLKTHKAWDSLKFHLKFNTGMNRLGINISEVSWARALLERTGVKPEGLCSHLASSDDPAALITRSQIKRFRQIVADFASLNTSYIHCANSGAIFAEKKMGLGKFCNTVRPGIAMYGYAGRTGQKLGLRPALEWHARVLASRHLSKGMVVGYGASFRADQNLAQAILGVGYGDGLKRCLSGRAIKVSVNGKLRTTRLLGRVSMDVASVELRLKPGSWVTLLGESEEQGRHLAESAGTIVYELLTSISSRVPRMYNL